MRKVDNIYEFSKCGIVSLDFETKSLIDFDVEVFSMAGYIDDIELEDNLIAGFFFEKDIKDMLDFIKGRRIPFHNFKFDGKVLLHYGFQLDSIRHEDTMIMAHLLDEVKRIGLKPRALDDLGMQMEDWSQELVDGYRNGTRVEEFLKYALDDAVATLKLFYLYRQRIIDEDLVTAYLLESKVTIPVIHMELNGILFDVDKAIELEVLARGRMQEVEDFIFQTAGRQVALTVPTDLARFLFDDLQIPYKSSYSEGMKTKARSVRKEVLDTLAKDYENDPRKDAIHAVVEWKRLQKMLSTFFSGQKQSASLYPDSRVRCSFNQAGTATGRFSCMDPNLQQLPVNPITPGDINTSIRAMYVAPPGKKFIDVDYSQIELRLNAHFSKDKNMIEGFINGEDFHQRTVELTGGILSRKEAKIANFGKLYGMTPYGFSYSAKIPVDRAFKYYQEYDRTFPGEKILREAVKDCVLSNGYVRMLGGRKRRMYSEDMDEGGIERVFLNSLIQGSAAVLLKMAMVALFERFQNKECMMVLQVHDELVFEVPEDKVDFYVTRIKEIMENCIKLRVPLIADAKVCSHFGEAKD